MIDIPSNIAKADIAQMPVELFDGRIIVIHSAADVEKAVAYLKGYPILGIDTETRPSFAKGRTYEIRVDGSVTSKMNGVAVGQSAVLPFVAE